MATPHIVGLASIARLYHPNMTGEEFKNLIKNKKSPVNTETNKPIANFVNVQEFLSALTGKQEEKKDEKTPLEKKDEKSSEQEKQEPRAQTRSEDAGDNELKAVIDESIGLEIQKDVKMEINSVWATEEDRIEINNAESNTTESIVGEQEIPLPQVFVSEGVEINNTEDWIDFSKIDASTGIMNTGDAKKLYGQEKTTIELSERDIPEWYTLINTDTDEEYPVSLGSQDEPLLEESQDTAIQNTYTCTTYVWYTCSYNLPAASIRQYNMSNTSVASVSAWSSSFTITWRSPGSSVLYVNYAGRTIATIYITIQKLLVPIGANYGTNTLEVGQSTYLTIRSGNGGYSVSSSNPSVISVSWNNTQWTLSAMNPGTATITYRDSAGYYGTINLTVTAPPRNLSVSIGQTTLERGKTTTLTINDGNSGYSVSSSNTSIISIAGNNTNWTLSAVWVGTSTLTVRDSRWKTANIGITVVEKNPTRTLRVSYNSNPHHIGWVSSITITDGNSGYTVTSSNPTILSVSGGGTAWTVTANSSWSVTVTIQDQRGMTVRLPYTVLRKISWSLSNSSPFVWQSATVSITNGNGGYTLTSSDPSVLSVRQTTSGIDTHYTVTALSTGTVTLSVRDRYGAWWRWTVTVRTWAKPFTVDKTTLTVEVWSDAYFRVTSGNWGYWHSKNNSNVWWSYDNSSIPSYRVRWVSLGSTILQIRDSSGKVVQVRVEVKELDLWLDVESKEFLDWFNTWFLSFLDWIKSWLKLSSAEDEWVEINSEATSEICELWRTGQYWARPYNAVCVDNISNDAWTCSGKDMVSLFSSHGINSCIDKRYTYLVKSIQPSLKTIQDKIGPLSENQSQIKSRIEEAKTKRNTAMSKAKTPQAKTTIVIVYDTLLNELYKKQYPQIKEPQDIRDIYNTMVLISQWCADCGGSSNTRYNDIASRATTIATKTFEYQLKYNTEFQREYNNSINTLLAHGGTRAEIEQGIREGITEGTRDYIMGYYDTVKSLTELNWDTIVGGMNGAWWVIKSPVASAQGIFASYKTTIEWLYQKVTHLSWYEWAKGSTYLGTNMWLSAADPAGKILKLAWWEFFIKIGGKLDELVRLKTATIAKKLVGKYKNLECVPFSDEFRRLLKKEGVGYREVYIEAYRNIVSDSAKSIFPKDLWVISTNWNHSATRVWDMIYDNVHPTGISVKAFKDDIGITEYPSEFKNLSGLD
jgi:hypothetical protein